MAIPEKIFFKIGEVCDLVGVQAHVLRYWETEFPMLSPQKNRSGQRTYRRRDVEIALRIKELLYDELFTIAGAKKKLQTELRDSSRLKIVHPEPAVRETFLKPIQPPAPAAEAPAYVEPERQETPPPPPPATEPFAFGDREETIDDAGEELILNDERREALKSLAAQLLELREMVKTSRLADENFRLRKY